MRWIRLLLPALLLASMAMPADAQIFFRRNKTAPNGQQVPELLVTAKADTDERHRIAAIEQLREYDIRSYPDMLTVLIDIMLSDSKSAVRLEALHSISRIRPMPQVAGLALQQAAQRDDYWRVRWQARSTLWTQGYPANNPDAQNVAPVGPTTREPPLNGVPTTSVIVSSPPPGMMAPGQPMLVPMPPMTTQFPAGTTIIIQESTIVARPLPSGTPAAAPRPVPPGFSTSLPQQPVRVAPPPEPNDGPTIIPVP